MERGFVKLWRKIMDNKSWSRGAVHRGVMMTLFVKANWKQSYFHGYEVKAGEIAISIVHLADELKLPRTTLQRIIKELEQDGLINIQNVGNRFSLISLQNWEKYQNISENMGNQWATNGQPVGNQRATSGQQVGTSKEYKNIRMKECKNQDINPLTPFAGGTDENGGETPQATHPTKRKREPTGNSREELIAYIKTHAISDELQEALIAFEEMRRVSLKKPLTDSAVKLLFNKLRRLAPNDEPTQTLIVQQSVMNGYQGIFDLQQPKPNLQPHKQTTKEAFDVVDRTFEKLRAAGFNV